MSSGCPGRPGPDDRVRPFSQGRTAGPPARLSAGATPLTNPPADPDAQAPARQSPLLALFRDPGFEPAPTMLPWGPPAAPIELVESFGEPAVEYAAMRKAAALMDLPQRGLLELTGPDRLSFLDRMLTQLLRDTPEGRWRASFWLSRQGRIDADVRVVNLAGRTLIDLDRHLAPAVRQALERFVITEDVALRDRSTEFHRLALHGPGSAPALCALAEPDERAAIIALEPGHAAIVRPQGQRVVVFRADEVGAPGLHIIVPRDAAAPLWRALTEGAEPIRPAGWAAFNVARIEAGTPLFCVDFGPTNLPHESGVLRDRVSFSKGCYLGQEVVARMEARKQFKASLAALRLDPSSRAPSSPWPEPHAGASVFAPPESPGSGSPGTDASPRPVGAVTSSAPSPMLGDEPVCFAMLRQSCLTPGTRVLIDIPGQPPAPATVRPGLRTLPGQK